MGESLAEKHERLEELRIDRDPESGAGSRWPAVAGGVTVLVGALLALLWWRAEGSGVPAVRTAAVRASVSGGPPPVLDASGYVTARRQATVSSKITGKLTDVLVEEGMAVQENQVLARLDGSLIERRLRLDEAQLAAAREALHEIEVRLRLADLDLERARSLAASGVLSRAELDRAEAERDALAARLTQSRSDAEVAARRVDLTRQELEDTWIRAPFAGVAVSKNAQPGEMISPISAGGGFTRTGVATVVDMASLEIEVDVNEAYIHRVHPDQAVVATLDAYPDWTIPAHVITTVPAADRQRATLKVRIAFDQPGDPRVLPDMGVKVSFLGAEEGEAAGLPTSRRLLVPREAVRDDASGKHVFVLRDGLVERRSVTVGDGEAPEVEVLAGLREGERVVVDPVGLDDGMRVRVEASGSD